MKTIIRIAFLVWKARRKCGGRIVRQRRSELRRLATSLEIAAIGLIDRTCFSGLAGA